MANTATFGAATPSNSTGHMAAAPISAESQIFCRPSTRPKRATTAQSNSAEKIFPTERVSKLMMPCRIAMSG